MNLKWLVIGMFLLVISRYAFMGSFYSATIFSVDACGTYRDCHVIFPLDVSIDAVAGSIVSLGAFFTGFLLILLAFFGVKNIPRKLKPLLGIKEV